MNPPPRLLVWCACSMNHYRQSRHGRSPVPGETAARAGDVTVPEGFAWAHRHLSNRVDEGAANGLASSEAEDVQWHSNNSKAPMEFGGTVGIPNIGLQRLAPRL